MQFFKHYLTIQLKQALNLFDNLKKNFCNIPFLLLNSILERCK